MSVVGYEFLRRKLGLSAFSPEMPAEIRPVTKVMPANGLLAIPAHVAPGSDDALDHVLFALKHEGVNLQILAQALRKLPADRMLAAVRQTPNGQYIRVAAFLWEHFNDERLPERPEIAVGYVDVFDPARYLTGRANRDPRWRAISMG